MEHGLTFLFPFLAKPGHSLVHVEPIVPERVSDGIITDRRLDVLQLLTSNRKGRLHLSWALTRKSCKRTSLGLVHAVVLLRARVLAAAAFSVIVVVVVIVIRLVVGQLG